MSEVIELDDLVDMFLSQYEDKLITKKEQLKEQEVIGWDRLMVAEANILFYAGKELDEMCDEMNVSTSLLNIKVTCTDKKFDWNRREVDYQLVMEIRFQDLPVQYQYFNDVKKIDSPNWNILMDERVKVLKQAKDVLYLLNNMDIKKRQIRAKIIELRVEGRTVVHNQSILDLIVV